MNAAFAAEIAALTPEGKKLAQHVDDLCVTHPLDSDALAKIEAELVGKGSYVLLAAAQYAHPFDRHLQAVIVKRDDQHTPYVVWSHNSECGGFFGGYYVRSMDEALKAFLEKAERYLW